MLDIQPMRFGDHASEAAAFVWPDRFWKTKTSASSAVSRDVSKESALELEYR
jgi:hypothetical protein